MNAIPHASIWLRPQRASLPWSRDLILRKVERETGVSIKDMKGKRRIRGVSHARHEAMYLLRANTSLSLPAIGQIMGGKDHSSVIYGICQHCKRNGLEVPK